MKRLPIITIIHKNSKKFWHVIALLIFPIICKDLKNLLGVKAITLVNRPLNILESGPAGQRLYAAKIIVQSLSLNTYNTAFPKIIIM